MENVIEAPEKAVMLTLETIQHTRSKFPSPAEFEEIARKFWRKPQPEPDKKEELEPLTHEEKRRIYVLGEISRRTKGKANALEKILMTDRLCPATYFEHSGQEREYHEVINNWRPSQDQQAVIDSVKKIMPEIERRIG